MIYPCVLLAGALGAVVFIMTFVVPGIRSVLEGQDSARADAHRVRAESTTLQHHYLVVLGVVLVVVIAIVAYFQTELGKKTISQLQLRNAGVRQDLYDGRAVPPSAACSVRCWRTGFRFSSRCGFRRSPPATTFWPPRLRRRRRMCAAANRWRRPLASSKVFPPVIVDMIAVAGREQHARTRFWLRLRIHRMSGRRARSISWCVCWSRSC